MQKDPTTSPSGRTLNTGDSNKIADEIKSPKRFASGDDMSSHPYFALIALWIILMRIPVDKPSGGKNKILPSLGGDRNMELISIAVFYDVFDAKRSPAVSFDTLGIQEVIFYFPESVRTESDDIPRGKVMDIWHGRFSSWRGFDSIE